jgi:N utilization substance protein B
MGMRREARERAIQFLFQYDINPPENLEEALNQFWDATRQASVNDDKATWGERVELPPPTADDAALRAFADPLIRGVLEKRADLDDRIQARATNWSLQRMAAVDRNILRLALFEMLHREDIPPVVSINEAVDIAKRYSTAESGKFVNGILDKIRGELLRPARIIKS